MRIDLIEIKNGYLVILTPSHGMASDEYCFSTIDEATEFIKRQICDNINTLGSVAISLPETKRYYLNIPNDYYTFTMLYGISR